MPADPRARTRAATRASGEQAGLSSDPDRPGGTATPASTAGQTGPSTPPGTPTCPAAGPSPAHPLTQRQAARRRRILRATAQLASSGGFDAVQMREVAERAEVALGTLYRYFPSKVHLLVATMYDQLERLQGTLREQPLAAGEPGERVAETLMRAFDALQHEPRLADAMVRALTFADRTVNAEVEAVSRLTTAIVLDAAGPAGPPSAAQRSAVRVIAHTWHSTLVTWNAGRASIGQVRTDIATVCRLIERPGTVPER